MIPDEAVEAAGEFMPPVWTSNPVYRDYFVRALEAAAPHLARTSKADAFEEGYGLGYSDCVWSKGHEPRRRNPYANEASK